MGVFLQNGNASVSEVFDNVGNDIFLNPINAWQNLGTITLGTTRLELWGCLKIVTAPATITVLLSNQQNVIAINLLEYSGVSAFGLSGTVSNTGYSSLFFQGTAENNTDILVSMFAAPTLVGGDIASGAGTYNIPGQVNFVITPATFREQTFAGSGQLLSLEQTVINVPQLIISQCYSQAVAGAGLMAAGVVLAGGLALQTPPGFSDIDETKLVAGSVLHALKLNQISQNASLGMVRPEFFYGSYLHGDTVIAPVSPVDQYQYQRDELIYIYTPYTTFDPKSGWTSASGILFYCQWDVDPLTGAVTILEFYHPDGNTPTNQTNDGELLVLTIAQRGNSGTQSGLQMANPPSLANVDLTLCGQDKPITQTLMQTLAKNSKFAAVKAEVFYMGEYVNGQVVLPPSVTLTVINTATPNVSFFQVGCGTATPMLLDLHQWQRPTVAMLTVVGHSCIRWLHPFPQTVPSRATLSSITTLLLIQHNLPTAVLRMVALECFAFVSVTRGHTSVSLCWIHQQACLVVPTPLWLR